MRCWELHMPIKSLFEPALIIVQSTVMFVTNLSVLSNLPAKAARGVDQFLFDDGRRRRTGGAGARDWLDAGRHPSGLSLVTPHPTSNGAYRMLPTYM